MYRIITNLASMLLLTFCSQISAQAAESGVLDHISANIGQHAVLRTEFTQTKQMAALKRPLITSGQLIYSHQFGVLWQITQPYRISYILGEDKIIEIDAQGIRKERSFKDVPGLAQVGRVFRAMLGTDAAALRNYFTVATQGNVEHWSISLKPKQAQLAQVIKDIQLSGSQFVNDLRINEASGDSAFLHFHNTEGANALNNTELQLFGNSNVAH